MPLTRQAAKIERAYNPEYDIPHAPCPEVSWVEYELLLMILELAGRIGELEQRVSDSEESFTRHRTKRQAHTDYGIR